MNFLLESLFVGIYTLSIYFILKNIFFINHINNYVLLFITGFLKHFMGWVFGLQTYYCKYGNACNKNNSNSKRIFSFSNNKYLSHGFQIWIESILEGFVFLLVGILFYSFIKMKYDYIFVFLTGFGLHILFEIVGIHKYFCLYQCKH